MLVLTVPVSLVIGPSVVPQCSKGSQFIPFAPNYANMKFSALTIAAWICAAPAVTGFVPVSSQKQSSSTGLFSEVERNANFAKLAGGYLFPEIGRRRNAYLEKNPEMASKIISLGIGDTTRPIPPHILNGLLEGVTKLGVKETYTGACVSAWER